MSKPKPPQGRPFKPKIKSDESDQLTHEWNKYKAKYRSEISQCGYIINNPYMR